MQTWIIAGTAFTASAVEAIEALTIVLAVGTARSWRSALGGAAWGVAVLVILVLMLGPALIAYVPLAALKLAIGVFLLVFGMAWLRKAILRYSGRKAMHDETAIYARNVATLGSRARDPRDRVGFVTAFNAVFLEGLEVAIIVVTVGSSVSGGLAWSAAGALAAVIIVALAGAAVRKPFARIPENAMKFVVGVMLTSLGALWAGEGLGIAWWGADAALLWIAAWFVACAAVTIAVAKRRRLAPSSARP
jgi:uncharacterized membrane protein